MDAADRRVLHGAAWLFLAGFVVHNLDHARRGLGRRPPGSCGPARVVAMVAAATLTLVLTSHRLAADAATVAGASIAIGVSATHLLPSWGALSDSLPDGSVDALTWLAVLAEVAGAVALAAAGFVVLRRHRYQLPRRRCGLTGPARTSAVLTGSAISAGSAGRSRSSGRRRRSAGSSPCRT